MEYKLYVGGARGSRTVCGAEFLGFGGQTSSYVITNGVYALLIDAGSGLSNLKDVLKDCKKVDIIFTHVHYDHVVGLLDFAVFPKGVVPRMHGMFHEWGIDDLSEQFVRKPFWPVPMPCQTLKQLHRGTRYAFGNKAPVIPALASLAPYQLTDAMCTSRQARNWIYVTLHESNHPDCCSAIEIEVQDKRLLFLCDFEHGAPLPPQMPKPYDIMFYDGMYTPQEYQRRIGYGHSTMEQGIQFAQEWGVKQLVITHHCPRRTDEELVAKEKVLQQTLKNGLLARMNMKIDL